MPGKNGENEKMHILIAITIVPILFSILCFIFKRAAFWLALSLAAFETAMASLLFFFVFYGTGISAASFKSQTLSCGVFLAASVFSLLVII